MRDSALILVIVAAILSCDGQGQGAVVNLVHERIATLNDAVEYTAIDRAPMLAQIQMLHAQIFSYRIYHDAMHCDAPQSRPAEKQQY
jgi:hypothetical protein